MKNPTCETNHNSFTCLTGVEGLMLDAIPEAVLLIDASLHLAAYNQAAKQAVWRIRSVEICVGMPALSLISSTEHTHFTSLAKNVFNGEVCTLEHPRQRFPDEIYEVNFLPVRDSAGQVTGILTRLIDISDRKKAERALQEAEERWQFAFEASSQAAWDWNMQTNEVIYSGSYKKMYGFLGDDLTNNVSEWYNRIHPEDKKRVEEAVEEHTKSDNPYYETTYRIQAKDGGYRWIMARGKMISKDRNRRPIRMIGTHTDLTETLQTKEELNTMNERFHYAAKASSQALWEWNAITGEAYVSPSFTEMFGWQADENNRFDQWHHYVHPDERRATIDHYYYTLYNTQEKIWEASYRLLKADGTYADVCDKAYILRDGEKKVLKVIGATQDVTALKKAEHELYKSNERFDNMMKATHDLLWDWDLETGNVYRSGEGLKKVYGVAENEALGTMKAWLARIHPSDRKRLRALYEGLQQAPHQETFEAEYRFQQADGNYTHVYDRGILLKNEAGQPVRIIGAAQNISERKRLEKELLRHELDMKKRINQATVDSQEQERSEIGRELHDNINQVLTTTKLYLELAMANQELREELLTKSAGNVGNVINEIRQLSRSLMDPTIGDLGIVDSINDLVENLNLTRKVRIDVCIEDVIEECLSRKQKLTVFRIIQEALNNVIRHAQASYAVIRIRRDDEQVLLYVEDNGVGFSSTSVKKGAGLKNITNRVYLINGNFMLESRPGEGSVVKINFPIQEPINA